VTLLRTRGLTVTVGEHTICRDLDLAVANGERWALLGGNGAGKTTLLHSLLGLHTELEGTVELAGETLAQLRRRRIAQLAGLLPQDSSDPFPASVLETALIGRHPHLGPWQWEGAADYAAARQALAEVGLEALEDRDVGTLSGGERRRLALATLITQDPAVWLLDEPTNHLDLHHQVTLLQRVASRSTGATLMSLHDVNLAERFCSHTLLMFGDGETLAGPVEQTLDTAALSRLYQHPIRRLDDGERRVFIAE
jgi:iron complex transport system ATP-binding protein